MEIAPVTATAAGNTHPTGMHSCVCVLSLDYAILTVRITEAFVLPKPSLFSNYKVMLFLCRLRVNKLNLTQLKFKSRGTYLVADWLVLIIQYCYIIFWQEHISGGKCFVI